MTVIQGMSVQARDGAVRKDFDARSLKRQRDEEGRWVALNTAGASLVHEAKLSMNATRNRVDRRVETSANPGYS